MATRYLDISSTYGSDGLSKDQPSGSNVTLTIASPCVVTWNTHGLAEGTKVFFYNLSASVPPTGLTKLTYYYVRNPSANSFNLSLTVGGALINTSGSQSGTHTLVTAPGCYNALYSVLLSAQGFCSSPLPPAGDTIIIRTADAAGSAFADINLLTGASATQRVDAATSDAHTTWVFDDGTEWPYSAEFVLTFGTSGTYTLTIDPNNDFVGNNKLVFKDVGTGRSWDAMITFGACVLDKVHFRYNASTTARTILAGSAEFNDCTFTFNKGVNTPATPYPYFDGGRMVFTNCTFDFNNFVLANCCLFGRGTHIVRGGTILNVPENKYLMTMRDSTTALVTMYGVDLNGLNPLDGYAENLNADVTNVFSLLERANHLSFCGFSVRGMPSAGPFDFYEYNGRGYTSWESLGNYPTLNAQLPDGTYWSIKCRAQRATSVVKAPIYNITKDFNAESAVGAVTVEMLVNTAYGTPADDDWMLEVDYFDTNGDFKSITTEGSTGAMTSSTNSAWTNYNSGTGFVGYAAANYNAYKIQIETPTAIKQDTEVTVRLIQQCAPPNSTSFYFIDPDFDISPAA
jgi:hypothetical protein